MLMPILKSALLRKALSLALLGFLVITLIGPVVALASTLLVFALIGLVTWPFLRVFWGMVTRSKDKVELPAAQAAPVQCEVRPCPAPQMHDRGAWRWVGEQARFTGGVVLELVSGALLGAMLGLLAGRDSPDVEQYVGIGALVGACVGIVVGKTGRESSAKPTMSA